MRSVAVVTGGSAGIGLATAELLAKRSWPVCIIARDTARLDQAAAMLRKLAPSVMTVSADVADADAVDAAAEKIEREFGAIGAWVNNAMSTVIAPADQITAAEYARVTATTYLSQVHGTLAALRYMKPRKRGAIIQVSSGLAIRAAPLQAAYCGAKFAVTGFTDALRSELIGDDIDVSLSIVYLPAVNTPQFEWSRNHTGRAQVAPDPVYDPRLCAKAIVHAIEKPSREVYVGRSVLMMATGQALVPSYADKKASEMREAQLGTAIGEREGNLFTPVPGPAAIDGAFTDRTLSTKSEYFSSRQRDTVSLGLSSGVEALAKTVSGIFRRRR